MLPAGTYCNVTQGQLNASGTGCTGGSLAVASNGIVTVSIPGNNGASTPAVALHVNQKVGGTAPTCTTVSVKFRVANANTVSGQSIYVPGSQGALGNWTGTTANVLTQEATGANAAWSRTVQLPPSTAIQYKFLKKGGGVGDVWERNQATASGNRQVTTAACGQPVQVLDAGSFAF